MNNYKLLASQAQLVNRYKNTRSKLQPDIVIKQIQVCWLNDFILSYYNTSGW
jgi:hypothetical protein